MTTSDPVARSGGQCELCTSQDELSLYKVPKSLNDQEIHLCEKCLRQVDKKEPLDPDHWKCLSESIWSEYPAI